MLDLRGVPVHLHGTTLGALALLLGMASNGGLPVLVAGLTYLGLLLIHAAGHAAVAHHLRHAVYRIEIYPLLAFCRSEPPRTRADRARIAWGGVLAQGLVLVPALLAQSVLGYTGSASVDAFLYAVIHANALSILLNLLPVAPFDGREAWSLLRRG